MDQQFICLSTQRDVTYDAMYALSSWAVYRMANRNETKSCVTNRYVS